MGGEKAYTCAQCGAFLTNKENLISNRFHGATGNACLFNRVVNVTVSEIQDRMMLTGRHLVRDVSCKSCDSKLGWMYEFAVQDKERYKEGKVILELALVREVRGLEAEREAARQRLQQQQEFNRRHYHRHHRYSQRSSSSNLSHSPPPAF